MPDTIISVSPSERYNISCKSLWDSRPSFVAVLFDKHLRTADETSSVMFNSGSMYWRIPSIGPTFQEDLRMFRQICTFKALLDNTAIPTADPTSASAYYMIRQTCTVYLAPETSCSITMTKSFLIFTSRLGPTQLVDNFCGVSSIRVITAKLKLQMITFEHNVGRCILQRPVTTVPTF